MTQKPTAKSFGNTYLSGNTFKDLKVKQLDLKSTARLSYDRP